MSKQRGNPKADAAPIQRDEKFTIREYRVKAPRMVSMFSTDSEQCEEPAAIIADLIARVDTVERCGIAPRLSVSNDLATLTLYAWRKVST